MHFSNSLFNRLSLILIMSLCMLLPVPAFALMSYACTVEPLRAANLLSGRMLYEVVHFQPGTPSPSSGAAEVAGGMAVGEVPPLDLFLIIAGGDPATITDRRLFNWLARLARATRQIGGVSGGPVILARAGLMNGRHMTVHWEHAAGLAEALDDAFDLFETGRPRPVHIQIPKDRLRAEAAPIASRARAVRVAPEDDAVAQAAALLERLGFADVSHLAGGIDAWADILDPALPRY